MYVVWYWCGSLCVVRCLLVVVGCFSLTLFVVFVVCCLLSAVWRRFFLSIFFYFFYGSRLFVVWYVPIRLLILFAFC